MMMKARKHHKSCSHIQNNLSASKIGKKSLPSKNLRLKYCFIELSRVSQVSSASTRTPIPPPKMAPIRRTGKQTTRIRKSFSLNDMKQFLAETRKDDIILVDSRLPARVTF